MPREQVWAESTGCDNTSRESGLSLQAVTINAERASLEYRLDNTCRESKSGLSLQAVTVHAERANPEFTGCDNTCRRASLD